MHGPVSDLVQADDRAHPILGPRLRASKPASLVLERGVETAPFVEHAWQLSRLGGGDAVVVAIVVNRVARARAIFDAIQSRLSEQPVGAHQAALLIGRSRAIDRDRLLADLLPRMTAQGRVDGPPLFVVATQCVEAGADLDLDAIVTEIAPLDALRQRFGRLNRTGRDIPARAVIIAAADQVAGRAKPDLIYGESLRHTWDLLAAKAKKRGRSKNASLEIDFGVEAARDWLPEGEDLARCLAPRRAAPVLLPAFVRQWMSTSPVPTADPDVALFLHGPGAGPGDVQIVWRADLTEGDRNRWQDRVAACPPSALEAVSLPLGEAAAWLRGVATADVADVEAAPEGESSSRRSGSQRALRWRGADDDRTDLVSAGGLRAGDVIVVPATRGGCDEWGWAPRARKPVTDLGDEANRRHRGRDILRLAPALLEAALLREDVEWRRIEVARARFDALIDELASVADREVADLLDAATGLPPVWRSWIARGQFSIERDDDGRPLALVRRIRVDPAVTEGIGEPITEDDRSVEGPVRVPLPEHSAGVRAFAEEFARRSALPEALVTDVALAAFLHDAGKAQPQFKLWMYRGDELACARGEALAKSGSRALPRGGLPRGARHEVASLWFALAHPRLRDAHDPELVLWLIGTHHGWGRPFFPPVSWPPPGEAFAVDLGDGAVTSAAPLPLSDLASRWIEIRDRLTAKYGPWGLAHLESILRLADHRRSEAEQEQVK
jgi:CRISPR-associated endonuclease/helicase Cas3